MKIILASASPRRSELMKKTEYPFIVKVSDVDENVKENLSPIDLVKKLAYLKASAIERNEDEIVIGADTIVTINGEIIGKPKDKQDAKNTLKKLSNKSHKVITGYAVLSSQKEIVNAEITQVFFNDLSDELIDKYIESGLPFGKAGSYGIQDGFPLVEKIIGDYDNVVGLPTNKIKGILKELYE